MTRKWFQQSIYSLLTPRRFLARRVSTVLTCALPLLLSLGSVSDAQDVYVVAPEYRGKKITESSLAIAPLSIGLVINNPNDLREHLGDGDPTEVFVSFVQGNLAALLREESSLTNVRYGSFFDEELNLSEQALSLGRSFRRRPRSMMMHLPSPGSTIKFREFSPEFILFLQDFTVSRSIERYPPEMDAVGVLMYTTKFAIWDVAHARLVCYGRAEAISPARSMSRETWQEALNRLAKSIVRKSPFRD